MAGLVVRGNGPYAAGPVPAGAGWLAAVRSAASYLGVRPAGPLIKRGPWARAVGSAPWQRACRAAARLAPLRVRSALPLDRPSAGRGASQPCSPGGPPDARQQHPQGRRARSSHHPYFFLSNFAESPVDFEGAVYPTVEHAFAAAKTLDPAERELIRLAPRPGDAKRLGRQVVLRPGWDDLRVEVMRRLLARKFAPGTELAARLLATGDARLVEGNTWGDRFWGVCRGQGWNQLGQLLMERREQLRRGLGPEHPTG